METQIIFKIAQLIVMTLCLIMFLSNLWAFTQTKDNGYGIWAIIFLISMYGVM